MSTSTDLQLPRKKLVPRLSALELRDRMKKELCIPVEEDYGWQILFWFPGMSASVTAHWWVTEGGPSMVGELYGPRGQSAHTLHSSLVDDRNGLYVHGDMISNTYMVLPAGFDTTLVPDFAVEHADPADCNLLRKSGHRLKAGFTRRAQSAELKDHWQVSRWIARHCKPEEYLSRLWLACSVLDTSREWSPQSEETETLEENWT